MSAPIALGIVGFGIMGERLLRAALGHAADSVAPVGVWDPAPESGARLAGVAAMTRGALDAMALPRTSKTHTMPRFDDPGESSVGEAVALVRGSGGRRSAGRDGYLRVGPLPVTKTCRHRLLQAGHR